jgi:hypothetical protein
MSAPFEYALTPALWDAAVEIAKRCLDHELALVGSVLAGPRQGIATVRRLGLDLHHIGNEDLRTILQACGIAEGDGILRLAKQALIADGLWDDGACAFERGRLWSDASLVSFAAEYPSPVEAERHAVALMAEVAKLDEAEELYRRATAILTDRPDAMRISPVARAKELVKFTRLSKVPVEQLNEWRRRASA